MYGRPGGSAGVARSGFGPKHVSYYIIIITVAAKTNRGRRRRSSLAHAISRIIIAIAMRASVCEFVEYSNLYRRRPDTRTGKTKINNRQTLCRRAKMRDSIILLAGAQRRTAERGISDDPAREYFRRTA